jgi:hypothetical protein
MRALILLVNVAILAVAWWLGSLTGLLIAGAVCVAAIVGVFMLSMSRHESLESRDMRRTMGRNTTFLAGLMGPRDRR